MKNKKIQKFFVSLWKLAIKILDFFTKLSEDVIKSRRSNVTDAPYIFGVILFILGVVASLCGVNAWIVGLIIFFGSVFLLTGIITHICFAAKNPILLTTEEHQRIFKAMEMMGDKENILNPNIKEITVIVKPSLLIQSPESDKDKIG